VDDTDLRVPASAYAGLAERLEREGSVAFRLSVGSALPMAGLLVGVPATALGLALAGALPWWLAAWALLVGVALTPFFAEQLLARPPALLVDGGGLHLRRWQRPLTIPWHELHEVRSHKFRSLVPRVVEAWVPWAAWDADQATRPRLLRFLASAGAMPRASDVRAVRVPSVQGHRPEVLAAWLRAERAARVPAGE
jgi:hypothetical protein